MPKPVLHMSINARSKSILDLLPIESIHTLLLATSFPTESCFCVLHFDSISYSMADDLAPNSQGIVLPAAEKYNGNPKSCFAFLTQCELRFRIRPDLFKTDVDKIGYIMLHLTGEASIWSAPYLNSESVFSQNYEAFRILFQQRFGAADDKSLNEDRLLSIKQGKRPFHEYLQEFQLLRSVSGWNDAALSSALLKGCNDKLKEAIAVRGRPAILDQLITLLAEIAGGFQLVNAEQQYLGTPMQVDAVKTSTPRPSSGLNSALQSAKNHMNFRGKNQNRSQNRTCYQCAKMGYIARYC